MGLAWIFKKLLWGNAFATEQGRIKLFGRMDWTLFPSRALALNLQTIRENLREDFVYQLGYQAGKDAAKKMVKYMGLKPRGGWVTQKAVIAMLDFIGFGKPEFVHVKVKKGGHHHIVVHVRDNPVIEQNPNENQPKPVTLLDAGECLADQFDWTAALVNQNQTAHEKGTTLWKTQ